MKKTKLIGMAALMFSLGLVGCGEDKPEEPEKTECEKHDTKGQPYKYDDTNHWKECSVCGAKVDEKAHSFKEKSNTATCKAAGVVTKECTCGKKIEEPAAIKEHDYQAVKDADLPEGKTNVAATCKDKGSQWYKCSSCGEFEATAREVPTTNSHDYVAADPAEGAAANVAAGCETEGKQWYKCTICGNYEAEQRTVAALGHDMVYVDTIEDHDGGVNMKVYQCSNATCKKVRYLWDAADASEASLATIKVGDNGGYQYKGNPIGNGITNPSSDNHDMVPDKTKLGDFFEYTFTAPFTKTGAQLIADLRTQSYGEQTGVFSVAGNDGDWTPGVRFVDKDGTETPEKIDDWRYVVEITCNGDPVTVTWPDVSKYQDEMVSSSRKVRTFPFTFDMTKDSIYTVKLIQAGGYESQFYSFGFEAEVETKLPAHKHNFVVSSTTVEAEGKTQTSTAACKCGIEDAITWAANAMVNTPSIDDKGNGAIRFNGKVQNQGSLVNKTFTAPAAAEDSTDAVWEYKINSAKAVNNARILFDMAPSKNAEVWNLGADDNTPGYVVDAEGNLVVSEIRYRIIVNGVEVALDADYATKEQAKTETRDFYEYPANISLKKGENDIKIVRYAGHRAVFYGFAIAAL